MRAISVLTMCWQSANTGKPGRFGQQVSVDHNMVQSRVYQYHSHNERKAQEADGSGLYVFFFFQCFFQCFIF